MPNLDGLEENSTGSKADVYEGLEDKLRTTWIEEVRRYHLNTTGRPSTYKPGPRLDGGIDAHGSKFKPVWPDLANYILSNNLDPVTFIKAQFANCRGKPPLSPLMLKSSSAIKRYQSYRGSKGIEQTLRIAKDGQVRQAYEAIETSKALYGPGVTSYRAVIMDTNIPLSALFRYSLAHSCGAYDLAEIWFDLALSQYVYDSKAYDAVWGELIPSQLKEAGKRLIAQGG